eukprot:5616736-Amphidinium_carterae.1
MTQLGWHAFETAQKENVLHSEIQDPGIRKPLRVPPPIRPCVMSCTVRGSGSHFRVVLLQGKIADDFALNRQ